MGLVSESLYFGGKVYGTERDLSRAVQIAQNCLALHPDQPICLAILGDCHLYGVIVPLDAELGEKLLLRSVAMDCPLAMNQLGRYYQHTLDQLARAIPLYQRATDLAYAPAMANLGVYYSFILEPPNFELTFDLLKRASELGEPFAMCGLAIFYWQEFKPPNLVLARMYFEQAAKLGLLLCLQFVIYFHLICDLQSLIAAIYKFCFFIILLFHHFALLVSLCNSAFLLSLFYFSFKKFISYEQC